MISHKLGKRRVKWIGQHSDLQVHLLLRFWKAAMSTTTMFHRTAHEGFICPNAIPVRNDFQSVQSAWASSGKKQLHHSRQPTNLFKSLLTIQVIKIAALHIDGHIEKTLHLSTFLGASPKQAWYRGLGWPLRSICTISRQSLHLFSPAISQ